MHKLGCNQKRTNSEVAQSKERRNPLLPLHFEQRACDALTDLMRVFRDFDNFRKRAQMRGNSCCSELRTPSSAWSLPAAAGTPIIVSKPPLSFWNRDTKTIFRISKPTSAPASCFT
jgi:hypothetical protein